MTTDTIASGRQEASACGARLARSLGDGLRGTADSFLATPVRSPPFGPVLECEESFGMIGGQMSLY